MYDIHVPCWLPAVYFLLHITYYITWSIEAVHYLHTWETDRQATLITANQAIKELQFTVLLFKLVFSGYHFEVMLVDPM